MEYGSFDVGGDEHGGINLLVISQILAMQDYYRHHLTKNMYRPDGKRLSFGRSIFDRIVLLIRVATTFFPPFSDETVPPSSGKLSFMSLLDCG